VILDFDGVALAGADISATSVVSHGDPRAVRDLMIEGRWLMRAHKITVFDEAAVVAEATALGRELRAASRRERQRLNGLIKDYDRWHDAIFASLTCRCCGRPRPASRIDECD
jgi:hypothetical protein